jgi:hypothetical protein
MKSKEFTLPVGMSGIMNYSHIECKEYPVETVSPEYVIIVNITEANDNHITFELKVSDNIEGFLSNTLNAIRALELCGAFDRQLIYHK